MKAPLPSFPHADASCLSVMHPLAWVISSPDVDQGVLLIGVA